LAVRFTRRRRRIKPLEARAGSQMPADKLAA
jgi:hypothetical protein